MTYKDITRRTLIRGVGGAVLGLPWLELTMGKAHAQTGPLQRLLVYFNGEGNLINQWKPNVPSGSALPASLPPMMAALNGYQQKLMMLHPIDNLLPDQMGGNAHNKAGRSILSAAPFSNPSDEGSPAAGPSIDQYLKQKLNVKSLELKVSGDGVGEYQMLFSGPGKAVSGEASPSRAFSRLFANLPTSGGGGTTTPPPQTAADRLKAKNKDILSLVKDNLTSVRSHLGKEDQLRLDEHAARIADLQKEVSMVNTAPPPAPAMATCSAPPQPSAASDPPTVNKAQAKIAAAAMACDFARIVTIQDTNYDSPNFSWANVSLPQRWHLCVHDHNPMSELQKGFAWYASAFKDILDAMDAIKEGDGTLLDHSLVLWITEYSDGGAHDTHGLGITLAGGLNGKVKMNRFVSFPAGSASTNQLFVTILNLFGVNENSFGQGPKTSGTLPGIA